MTIFNVAVITISNIPLQLNILYNELTQLATCLLIRRARSEQ